MKAIMVMFDSLNRHMLPNYGCDWVHAPNFRRLGERTVTFENSYVCSMPCMPARRDMHTGRPNFLHRSWGPLEPFDESMPELLHKAGVHTHLTTDHYHYFEDGGATYHNRYSSWQFFRGQEGDKWMGQVAPPTLPDSLVEVGRTKTSTFQQDMINRQFMQQESQQPQPQTFGAGLDFIERNAAEDNWFLQIETFDPHEPFFTHRKYKDLYAKHYDQYRASDGRHYDWPPYREVREDAAAVEHLRHEYAALMSMCDVYMGEVLDAMDRHKLWDDTMLIVCTDHGFMLGEKDCYAKCWLPFYQEIAHTPFFVWDPRPRKQGKDIAGQRRRSLVQPAIDLPVTLLEYFGQPIPATMLGKNLQPAVAHDAPLREAAIFGIHGSHVNVTDGRYVYMHAPLPDNAPLYDYTLMPTRMNRRFNVNELATLELAEPFEFTQGCRTLKIPTSGRVKARFANHALYDLANDPAQEQPIDDPAVQRRMIEWMTTLMAECDAPAEQFARLGVEAPQRVAR